MATPASADAMREILGQYDVKNITPRSFSEMLQKLRQANSISEKDYQELSQIRMDLDRDGLGPDERVNLVEHYQRKLSNLQDDIKDLQGKTDSTAVREALQAPVLRRLDWLQKLATMHAQPVRETGCGGLMGLQETL